MTTALLGIAGIAGIVVLFIAFYFLRWVLIVAGIAAIVVATIFAVGYFIEGNEEVTWPYVVMLCSIGAIVAGSMFIDEEEPYP